MTMQQHLTPLIFYAFLLLNLFVECESSSSFPAEINGRQISQEICCSYQSHKPWMTLISEVECELRKLQRPCPTLVTVDISSSLLGNEGLDALSRVLFGNTEDVNQGGLDQIDHSPILQRERYPYCKTSLEARMNRLSGRSVGKFLDRIIEWESPVDVSDIEGSKDVEGEKDDIDSSPTLTEKHFTANPNHFQNLDLGLNDLTKFIEEEPALESSLSRFMIHVLSSTYMASNQSKCLRFDRCNLHPNSCRAIGMGIVKGIQTWNEGRNSTQACRGNEINVALHLSGNEFGCAGTAALAAALKLSHRRNYANGKESTSYAILDTLNLSSCNVGDAGAEALAFALETNPGCVRSLDLSHNKITQRGAVSLGRALQRSKNSLERLDLSQNDIGEEGVEELAVALERGCIKSIILRTCSINANGCTAIGTALGKLTSTARSRNNSSFSVEIDISGNRIGTQKKVKKPKSYSASALTSKASATTMSSLNFIGKKIKSGLRDVGVDMSDPFGVSSLESDDDDQDAMSDIEVEEGDVVSVKDSCGASAFYDSFVKHFSEGTNGKSIKNLNETSCQISMRMCSFDGRGQDALAALFLHAIEHSIKITLDATMNDGIGNNEMANRVMLRGGTCVELEMMAERHLDLVAAKQKAQERAHSESAMFGAFDFNSDVYDEDEGGSIPQYSDEYDAQFF